MNVDDLYLIIRELRQLNVLQSNLLESLGTDPQAAAVYQAQQQAQQLLQELVRRYERYDI